MPKNYWPADEIIGKTKADRKWDKLPTGKEMAETVKALEQRGIKVYVVENRQEALGRIKKLIPAKANVMNGSSTTLIEIGFTEHLESKKHGWRNLHDAVNAEEDPQSQAVLRRRALTSDYYLSGVNAIAQTGEIVAADASGSRVGAWPFAAGKLILVAGINKIVPTLEDALRRVREYALPLEDARAKQAYGVGSMVGKIVIIENEMMKDRTTLILVREKLGY